jgi:hypothetical protein
VIIYEFWHRCSNNLIATFDTEAETRRALEAMFDDSSALADFVLTWDDVDEAGDDDDVDRPGGLVAYGEALVEIARGGPFPPLVNVFLNQS